jgi:hypothetical protein
MPDDEHRYITVEGELAAANRRAALAEAELSRLKNPAAPLVVRDQGKRTFLRSDLADAAFYEEHKAEILLALAENRIVDDKPSWRVPNERRGVTK